MLPSIFKADFGKSFIFFNFFSLDLRSIDLHLIAKGCPRNLPAFISKS
jgi:hypothetical protein